MLVAAYITGTVLGFLIGFLVAVEWHAMRDDGDAEYRQTVERKCHASG